MTAQPSGWFALGVIAELASEPTALLKRFGLTIVVRQDSTGAFEVRAWPDSDRNESSGNMSAATSIVGDDAGPGLNDGVAAPIVSRVLDSMALDSVLFAWYHPESLPASWIPNSALSSDLNQFQKPCVLKFRTRASCQTVGMNYVDDRHFVFVHGNPELPLIELQPSGSHLTVRTSLTGSQQSVDGWMHTEFSGPGILIQRQTGILNATYLTPVDSRQTDILMLIYGTEQYKEGGRRCRLEDYINNVKIGTLQDIKIWDHQRMPADPVCDRDPLTTEFLRWFRQFTSLDQPK